MAFFGSASDQAGCRVLCIECGGTTRQEMEVGELPVLYEVCTEWGFDGVQAHRHQHPVVVEIRERGQCGSDGGVVG